MTTGYAILNSAARRVCPARKQDTRTARVVCTAAVRSANTALNAFDRPGLFCVHCNNFEAQTPNIQPTKPSSANWPTKPIPSGSGRNSARDVAPAAAAPTPGVAPGNREAATSAKRAHEQKLQKSGHVRCRPEAKLPLPPYCFRCLCPGRRNTLLAAKGTVISAPLIEPLTPLPFRVADMRLADD